jgi:chaperone modulatory protein CbpM
MADKEIVIIADYSQNQPITLLELCELSGLDQTTIRVFIEYDILQPSSGAEPSEWQFDLPQVQRLKKAQRLQRDLELNLAGVALVLELVEEMDNLRARMQLLERHYLK